MGCIDPKLVKAVIALVGSEAKANLWWNTPNLAFHHDTPLFVYANNPSTVKIYIEQYLHYEAL